MRRRGGIARGVVLVGALTFFEGKLGLAVGLAAFVACEVAGVSVSVLWAGAVGTLGLAAVAMIVQGAVSHPAVDAAFAQSFGASRTLVEMSMAMAAYAAVLELTAGTELRGAAAPRRRRRGRPAPAPPAD